MKIQHLRNATALISIGDRVLLLDPMLCDVGRMPGFRLFRGERRRNPLVPLPSGWESAAEEATDILITHEHPDHLDGIARRWVRQRGLPVWASSIDASHLKASGLDARVLRDGDLGLRVERIPAQHGRGLIGWFMGHVSGFYLAHPLEPTLYITGDSVLSHGVADAIERLQPDIVLVPGGAANFGPGGDILFSLDELVDLTRRTHGKVVVHHLEAIDHCLMTRRELRARMESEGLSDRVLIPEDGETFAFDGSDCPATRHNPTLREDPEPRPDFRKWLTSKMA